MFEIPESKRAERERLELDIKKFLEKGGQVYVAEITQHESRNSWEEMRKKDWVKSNKED